MKKKKIKKPNPGDTLYFSQSIIANISKKNVPLDSLVGQARRLSYEDGNRKRPVLRDRKKIIIDSRFRGNDKY